MADDGSLKPCFVIAPIGEVGSETRKRSSQVFKHLIEPAARACGYQATWALDMSDSGTITHQVIGKGPRACPHGQRGCERDGGCEVRGAPEDPGRRRPGAVQPLDGARVDR